MMADIMYVYTKIIKLIMVNNTSNNDQIKMLFETNNYLRVDFIFIERYKNNGKDCVKDIKI